MPFAAPISEVLIDVNRAAVDATAPTTAAIDRGCSLSKFLYVAKDFDESSDHYTFHCALFRNEDFESALHLLKEKALLPPQGKLRVTGAGCDMYKDLIAQVLGLEIEFVDEFGSGIKGTHFLMSHAVSPDALLFPKSDDQPKISIERPPELEALIKKMQEKVTMNNGPDPNAKFPCLLVILGSAAGCFLINEDGTGRIIGVNTIGGKSLLGLGKALVGTNNYDELMELAEKGCVTNVDTTVGEFLRDDPNSPYGKFPSHLPLFSFGKMIDSKRPLEDYEAADRAAALIRLMAMNVYALALSSVSTASVSRVLIGGNGIRGQKIRDWIMMQEKVRGDVIDIKFLNTGHTGAFGAMTTGPKEAQASCDF